ncbi:hypothetical protein [Shewanella woodyi]|uniref:Uncharacterized protein n=1 Tax=Shewanella woodyi (strain ATCC 51908 / MS32) TaxID=392500 RepID=B1KJF2_SHEWM|nr:hypothetical protein [Shewanella woodyi]ACA88624.1 conserved hypothetical protein [Shewanella woodyi ATCC 51908]
MLTKLNTCVIACLIFSYPLYLWSTYIDKTILKGSAFEFIIGSSKSEVYENLPLALSKLKGESDKVFIQVKSNEELAGYLASSPDFNVWVNPYFHPIGYAQFASKDEWDFYINASFTNVLKLKFCEGRLCEIYRHRQYFELP